jgi:hypothetical protein
MPRFSPKGGRPKPGTLSYNWAVDDAIVRSQFPESFLEHRQFFVEPWVDLWTIPNPFISAILKPLREIGVELTDVSFNKDATSLGDTYLNCSIRKLNAAVRVGLDVVTFIAANPDWGLAPQLVPTFDHIAEQIRNLVGASPKSQEAILAFHVTPGTADFRQATSNLVNTRVVGECIFYGVSLHRTDGAVIIDKSLRHEGAAFVRLQRRFAGEVSFADVASRLFEDEIAARRMLGISDVP